jgi:hypothetical protein
MAAIFNGLFGVIARKNVAGGASYILDDISGSADFAFSASRYLASAYVGSPVVKLREDATSTTSGFKLVGGVLVTDDINEDTVAAWLTANSATVATVERWYDQSGNARDVQQLTTADQPTYTASWSNGKASIKGGATGACRLTTVASFTPSGANGASGYLAMELVDTGYNGIFGDPNSSTFALMANAQKPLYFADSGSSVSTTSVISLAPHMVSYEGAAGGNPCTIRVDRTQDATAALIHDMRSGTWVMFQAKSASPSGSQAFSGYIGELIFANSAFSTTDRDAIEASEKAWFNLP